MVCHAVSIPSRLADGTVQGPRYIAQAITHCVKLIYFAACLVWTGVCLTDSGVMFEPEIQVQNRVLELRVLQVRAGQLSVRHACIHHLLYPCVVANITFCMPCDMGCQLSCRHVTDCTQGLHCSPSPSEGQCYSSPVHLCFNQRWGSDLARTPP